MPTYVYDQVPVPNHLSGYNLIAAIEGKTGRRPISRMDATVNGVMKTHLVFESILTPTEEVQVQTIINQFIANGGRTPLGIMPVGARFNIKDLHENLADLEALVGCKFYVFYTESVLGSKKVDKIDLLAERPLSNPEENLVISWYKGLINKV